MSLQWFIANYSVVADNLYSVYWFHVELGKFVLLSTVPNYVMFTNICLGLFMFDSDYDFCRNYILCFFHVLCLNV